MKKHCTYRNGSEDCKQLKENNGQYRSDVKPNKPVLKIVQPKIGGLEIFGLINDQNILLSIDLSYKIFYIGKTSPNAKNQGVPVRKIYTFRFPMKT